jgi:hypothetical protein
MGIDKRGPAPLNVALASGEESNFSDRWTARRKAQAGCAPREKLRADRCYQESERVPELHEKQVPFAAEAVIEADDGRQIPGEAEARTAGDLPILHAESPHLVKRPAHVHERHEHGPEILILDGEICQAHALPHVWVDMG